MGTSLAKSIWLRRYIHNYCLSYMFKSEFAKCSRFSQTVGIYCKIKWAVSFQDKKKTTYTWIIPPNRQSIFPNKMPRQLKRPNMIETEKVKMESYCFRKTFSDSEHLEMTQLNIYGTVGTWTPASRLQISWRTRTTHIVMNHDS